MKKHRSGPHLEPSDYLDTNLIAQHLYRVRDALQRSDALKAARRILPAIDDALLDGFGDLLRSLCRCRWRALDRAQNENQKLE
jgi:hypothetical protein